MENKAETAKRLFLSGANCSQAVIGAFQPGVRGLISIRRCASLRASAAGMGRLREVCGAVSGMFMAAGLLRGSSDLRDKAAKDAHYALIQELAEAFRRENGSIVCRELLGLGAAQADRPVSEARTPEYYRKRPCAELVAFAAGLLEEKLKERLRAESGVGQ